MSRLARTVGLGQFPWQFQNVNWHNEVPKRCLVLVAPQTQHGFTPPRRNRPTGSEPLRQELAARKAVLLWCVVTHDFANES